MFYYYLTGCIFLNDVYNLLNKINITRPDDYYVMWLLKMSRVCMVWKSL